MEKYLEKAILSLINQTFQNFEIIIVNDNSNDNTEKILKKLEKEFNKIKVISHHKNLGVYLSRIDAVLIFYHYIGKKCFILKY
jgi:glycosyltransferase involved in cell wall biosynthesis